MKVQIKKKKGLFPAPTAMEERVGRIFEGIWCGVRVCPNTPGYEQEPEDHEKQAWEMTQNLLLKLR